VRQISTLICLSLTSLLQALPIGNPSEPKLLSSGERSTFRVGYCNETVAEQPLMAKAWAQEAKWTTNYAQITLNMLGKLDAFATLGVCSLQTQPRSLQSSLPEDGNANACIAVRTFPAAAYGYGLRATLLNFAGFYLGAESQILFSSPRPFFSTSKSNSKQAEEQSLHFKQQQVGLAASYTLPTTLMIIPYAGVRWQQVSINFDDLSPPKNLGKGGALRSLKEQTPWASALGAAVIGKKQWSVSVEGNIWTEKTMNLTAQLKY
jgi:hypothetical protein